MIGRRARERQTQGDVYRLAERGDLDGRHSDIVVWGDHRIKVSAHRAHEHGVGREGTVKSRVTSRRREQRVVLVADDEKDVRQLVAYRLRAAGYDVVEAEDGEEALRLAEERPPDLVVLDVMMPKLDGFEVARRLRANDATRRPA